jgi:hypothetical protein
MQFQLRRSCFMLTFLGPNVIDLFERTKYGIGFQPVRFEV